MKQIVLYLIAVKIMLSTGSPIASRSQTPCLDHYQQAVDDLLETRSISESVGYLPWCHSNGVTWQEKQCTSLNGGSCFCVNSQTGVILENTRTSELSWDSVVCGDSANAITCEDAILRYSAFSAGNPNVADAPFGYMPSCAEGGKFEAMQRNAFYFFCVDVTTGQEIPESESVPGIGKPLTEEICQTYSELWQNYRLWLEETGLEVLEQKGNSLVTEATCPEGFEFQVCGCERNCIAGKVMPERMECEQCKPVCVCPIGTYQHNGTCVTSAECQNMEEEQFTFKVRETLWNSYLMVNSNDLLKTYWAMTDETATANQTSGEVDVSNANATVNVEETSSAENSTEDEDAVNMFGTFSEEYFSDVDEEGNEEENDTSVTEIPDNTRNQQGGITGPAEKSEIYERVLQNLPPFLAKRLRVFRQRHHEMFERS